MRLIIKDINYSENTFYAYVDGRRVAFYLTNKYGQTFMDYLDIGYLVDFEITEQTKIVNGYKAHQVNHFNLITNLRVKKDLYNHFAMKKSLVKFLDKHENYLFLDLEMTMAMFRQKNFKAEILQYGYVLVDQDLKTIKENSNYLLTKSDKLNRRIFRFLNITESEYFNKVITALKFYQELQLIIDNYNPKIVVWGKNDIKALNDFYHLHQVTPLTNHSSFVDLLRVHRNFFNLKNDLGLFNAYKEYYLIEPVQEHDAIEDAKVTKAVFEAFKNYARFVTRKI